MKKDTNLTKEYIFQAFYVLLTKQHYDKISVCDICQKAGVSRMSFYRNFESKEDLTLKGLDKIMNKFKESIKSQEEANLYVFTKAFFDNFKEYKDILPSLEETQILRTIRYNTMYKLKENAQIDYMNKTSKYIPVFYFSAISATVFEWLKDGTKESSDEMARLIMSLINIPNFQMPCN